MLAKKRYKKASSRITRRNKAKKIFGLFLKIAIPTAFFAGLIFLSRADFLQVKSFEITGAETIRQESIKDAAGNFASGTKFFMIPRSNIFILNKENLASALLSAFPRLEKVEVNKRFFSKSVELKIAEREADFLWCLSAQAGSEADKCFSMSKNGLVFEQFDPISSDALLSEKIIFRGVLVGNPLMKNFATGPKMQNYINMIEVFKNAGFGVSAINIELEDKAVVEIKINEEVSDIIFNPEESDLSLVAQNTILLINETKSKNSSARFDYIDARFGNKFFYKLY